MTEAKVDRVARAKRKGQKLADMVRHGMLHVKLSPVTEDGTKECVRCGRYRPLVMFPPRNKWGDKNDRVDSCQGCLDSLRYKRHRQKITTSVPVALGRRAARMWNAARLRAWRHRVPFTITKQWFVDRLLAGKCEMTGLEFATDTSRGSFVPSIDREVPALGYTVENCRMVVWLYNAGKSSGTDEDFMIVARALVEAERKGWETRKRMADARKASSASAEAERNRKDAA